MKRKITLENEIRRFFQNEEVWEWLVNHGVKTICNENRHSLFGIKNGTCECREMGNASTEIKGSKFRKVCIFCRIGEKNSSIIREKIYTESFKEEVIEVLLPILTKAFMKYVSHNTICGSVYIPHYYMKNHKGIHYRVAEAVQQNKSMYENSFEYVNYCPFSYLMGKVRETLFVNIDSGEVEQILSPVEVNGYPLLECVIIALACPEVAVEKILEVREKKKPEPVVAPKPDGSVYYSNIEADNEANFVGFFND